MNLQIGRKFLGVLDGSLIVVRISKNTTSILGTHRSLQPYVSLRLLINVIRKCQGKDSALGVGVNVLLGRTIKLSIVGLGILKLSRIQVEQNERNGKNLPVI